MEIEPIERRLKLHDLRVLMSVIQAGSMHRAAERLGTTQPTVSRAIADLEHALGVRLLDRSPSGVEPTQYGRALIKRGLAVFDELRQGVKDIAFLADPTAGELRVGCSEALAAGPVLAVIDRLSRQHPRIVFHVMTASWPSLHRQLTERNLDLVIDRVSGARAEESLVVEPLFDDSHVVAAGLENRWTRRRRVELAELVNEPWTFPSLESFFTVFAAEAFRASGLEPPHATVFALSLNMRNRLLATGRFLTMLPGIALTPPGKHPLLKALPVNLPNATAMVGIVTLKNRTLSPLAQLFIEHAREVAKLPPKRK